MRREIVDQIIPHLGVMLVDLVALHGPIGNGKRPGALKHERHSTFGDAHLWRGLGRCGLELLIRNTVGDHATFEADAAGLETVASARVLAVDQTHQLRSHVTMVIRWAVRVRGNVPTRREDEEIGKRRCWVARACRQDAKDGRINVVDADASDVDKFREVVLVWVEIR